MNIFIAGISYNLSNADLGELFEEFGEVISAKIVMDRETGRSKGFGFVEMTNDEEGNILKDTCRISCTSEIRRPAS